jgi:hypothetical protein
MLIYNAVYKEIKIKLEYKYNYAYAVDRTATGTEGFNFTRTDGFLE